MRMKKVKRIERERERENRIRLKRRGTHFLDSFGSGYMP